MNWKFKLHGILAVMIVSSLSYLIIDAQKRDIKVSDQSSSPRFLKIQSSLDPITSGSVDSLKKSSWYTTIVELIQKEEYNVTFNEETQLYQSPNRQNNLRFTYTGTGFIAEPRDQRVQSKELLTEIPVPQSSWKVCVDVVGLSKGERSVLDFSNAVRNIEDNQMVVENAIMKMVYTNAESGMRQDFIIKEKPEGNDLLRLYLNVSTKLDVVCNREGLSFLDKKTRQAVLNYNELKVWDAQGRILKAHFEEQSSLAAITVDDKDAVYPLTIDPLSSTPSNTVTGPDSNEGFGFSGSFAGDVNGDGYGDVIVGAPYYDGTYTDEGKVFVLYGSSSGISISNYTALYPNGTTGRNDCEFGYSVAAAGDVNGDGYSDVIVGAWQYGSTCGRTFVYLGGSSGISTSAVWYKDGDYPYDAYGTSVASAGDVNGDGYSDIVIGAVGYNFGAGAAFVYHGTSTGVSSTHAWMVQGVTGYDFAVSVSGAGDVNGDGYSDIIVGDLHYSITGGKAYLWLGSSTGITGTYSTPAWSYAGASGDYIGRTVSTAGDINADGYSDLIIGSANASTGHVYVFYGTSGSISSTPDWSASGGDGFGISVQTAGDVNGDGYADVIIGSPNYDNSPNTDGGAAYVFLGGISGMGASGTTTNADWKVEPAGSYLYTGLCAASAGDVNGDGFSDVMVGSYTQSTNGVVNVYYGMAGTLSQTANWTNETNVTGATYYGFSVASAGDVNGDGYSDAIVGAYGYDNGQTDEGRVFVYLGTSTGFSTSASWTAESNSANSYFGYSVSTAGNCYGDGYSDVIIGAPYYDNGEENEGRVYYYKGSSSGLGSTPVTFESNQEEALFGFSVSSLGDINRDGFSDILIGAPYWDGTYVDEGKAYAYYGACDGFSSPNWTATGGQQGVLFGYSLACSGAVTNNDYGGAVIGAPNYSNGQAMEGRIIYYHGQSNPSGLYTSPAWFGESDQAYAYLGWSVAGLGDVNGDNYADIAAGAPYFDNGQTNEGKVFVWYGSQYGLNLGVDGTGSNVDWSSESNSASSLFGYCVSSAGDVNGDGFCDVVFGAPNYSNGNSLEGATFLWKGSSSGINGGTNGAPSNANWSAEGGQDGAYFGISAANLGDMNGDGYSDVIVGAYKYDNGQTDEGRIAVYYGNEAAGVLVRPRQFRSDLSTNVVHALYSNSSTAIGLGFTALSYQGRMDIKVHRSVTETNQSQTTTNSSSSWLDVSSSSGYYYGATVTSLSSNRMFRWKIRMEYSLAQNPVQKYSRWYYLSNNSVTEGDISTGVYGVCNPDGRLMSSQPSASDLDVSVFPNPASDIINLELGVNEDSETHILVYDMAGNAVLEDKRNLSSGKSTLQYNTSEWSNGIYFFQVTTGDVTNTVRVVIAK